MIWLTYTLFAWALVATVWGYYRHRAAKHWKKEAIRWERENGL